MTRYFGRYYDRVFVLIGQLLIANSLSKFIRVEVEQTFTEGSLVLDLSIEFKAVSFRIKPSKFVILTRVDYLPNVF